MKIILIALGILAYLIATVCILYYATHSKPRRPLLGAGWMFFTILLAVTLARIFGLFH